MLLLVTVTEQNFDWSLLVQRRWGWFTSRFTYYTADNTFFFREHHNRKITTVLSVTDKRHVYDYTVFQPAAYKNRLCNANNCEIDSPQLLWGRVLPLNRGLTMYPAKARLHGGFGNGPRKKKDHACPLLTTFRREVCCLPGRRTNCDCCRRWAVACWWTQVSRPDITTRLEQIHQRSRGLVQFLSEEMIDGDAGLEVGLEQVVVSFDRGNFMDIIYSW